MQTQTKFPLIKRIASPALAFAAGVALTIGAGALAGNVELPHMHHAHALSAADQAKHIDAMLDHVYRMVQATDAQKAQLDPILRQAFTDLSPMHQQLLADHQQLFALMTQNTIDRAALEVWRGKLMQDLDPVTKRIAQVLADTGDVLTQAQRKALAEHIAAMHGGGHV